MYEDRNENIICADKIDENTCKWVKGDFYTMNCRDAYVMKVTTSDDYGDDHAHRPIRKNDKNEYGVSSSSSKKISQKPSGLKIGFLVAGSIVGGFIILLSIFLYLSLDLKDINENKRTKRV